MMDKATELLYGRANPVGNDTGKASINISGFYANNWSSFKTPEKILRLLVPGKTLKIEGSASDGYYLNNGRMVLIGEDLYTSPAGLMKFIERDGKVILAAETAISYTKVPGWQVSLAQVLAPVFFILLTIICLLREMFFFFTRRKKDFKSVFLICSLLQLISFSVLCLLIIHGISAFSLLTYLLPIKLCGWVILGACTTAVGYMIYRKLSRHAPNPISVVWNLSGLVFCAFMAWYHIL